MTERRVTQRKQLTVHHARSTRLPAGTARLAALDATPDRDPQAPTVLLLPGYTGSKEDFAPLLDPLAEKGLRGLAIDLPGQFESPGPDDESAYDPDRLGAVVVDLLAAFDAPVVLVGHSYGGLVARAAVLAGARVAGLVLLDSGPAELPPGQRRRALEVGEPVLRDQGVAAAYAVGTSLTDGGHASAPEPELEAFYRRRFLASSAAGLLGMAAGLISEPDRVAELAAALELSRLPVAVITGEADDAWGLDLQADMARRLGVGMITVPGAAHSPAVEQPDRLLRILFPLLHTWTSTPG